MPADEETVDPAALLNGTAERLETICANYSVRRIWPALDVELTDVANQLRRNALDAFLEARRG
jgi:hypothetical protein